MAWFPDDILTAVEKVARVYYINKGQTHLWNTNRRGNELRLLTGWTWVAKDGSDSRQGYKTASAAIRDAFYVLVRHQAAPASSVDPKNRLKLVTPTGQSKRKTA